MKPMIRYKIEPDRRHRNRKSASKIKGQCFMKNAIPRMFHKKSLFLTCKKTVHYENMMQIRCDDASDNREILTLQRVSEHPYQLHLHTAHSTHRSDRSSNRRRKREQLSLRLGTQRWRRADCLLAQRHRLDRSSRRSSQRGRGRQRGRRRNGGEGRHTYS